MDIRSNNEELGRAVLTPNGDAAGAGNVIPSLTKAPTADVALTPTQAGDSSQATGGLTRTGRGVLGDRVFHALTGAATADENFLTGRLVVIQKRYFQAEETFAGGCERNGVRNRNLPKDADAADRARRNFFDPNALSARDGASAHALSDRFPIAQIFGNLNFVT